MPQTQLASDNYATIHPAVLQAIADANTGHTPSYGADPHTEALTRTVSAALGVPVRVYPVLTGTGANVVSVTAVTPRWGAVVTSSHGHMIGDEGGAPIRLSGIPLLPVASTDGKLTVAALEAIDWHDGFVHTPQATTLSIANTTELGTVYTPDEIAALSDWAHSRGMLVHLDGARIFNAIAATGASLKALTSDAGVDVFSIGATKTGALAAEAVVVVNPQIPGTEYIQKYLMQMPSKARFISAQVGALLANDLGVTLAAHANAMAKRLIDALTVGASDARVPGIELTQKLESNQVFVRLPRAALDRVRADIRFYDWDTTRGEVRWVTSWDTSADDIDAFVAIIVSALEAAADTAQA